MTAYGDIVRACGAAIATVTAVKVVTLYEPKQMQEYPHVYVILDGFTRSQAGQVTSMRPRLLVRLLVPIPTSEDLEIEAVETAFLIADAIDRDSQFGGVIVSGLAQTPEGRATWVNISGTKTRAIDIFCDALYKQPYAGAI